MPPQLGRPLYEKGRDAFFSRLEVLVKDSGPFLGSISVVLLSPVY